MNSFGIRLIKAFLFFIPKANPDNEKLYPLVALNNANVVIDVLAE